MITPEQEQRLATRLTQQGMHPVTARNVVQHVAVHGKDSPWARQVHIAAFGLPMVLMTEVAVAYARAAAPIIRQINEVVAAIGRQAADAGIVRRSTQARPAWQTPYGPPMRRRS